MFWVSRDRVSFQSAVSAAKEAELIQREKFGDLKRVCTLRQFLSAFIGGRGMTREVIHFSTVGFMQPCQPQREDEVPFILLAHVRVPLVPSRGL